MTDLGLLYVYVAHTVLWLTVYAENSNKQNRPPVNLETGKVGLVTSNIGINNAWYDGRNVELIYQNSI